MQQAPRLHGCTHALGFLAGALIWTLAAAYVLYRLDINPWWSALVALSAVGLYGYSLAFSGVLTRAAAAAWLHQRSKEQGAGESPQDQQEEE